MKLKVVVLSLLLLGSSGAYAGGTPDILKSMPSKSSTVIQKGEASKLRGGYRVCITNPRSIAYGQCNNSYYLRYQGAVIYPSSGTRGTYAGMDWRGYYVAR